MKISVHKDKQLKRKRGKIFENGMYNTVR